ncbi:MAG: endopeptidase La [Anaerolineales bacterium]
MYEDYDWDDEWEDDENIAEDEDDLFSLLQQRTDELYEIADAVPDDEGIIEVPVLPLRDVVVFPRMISPVFVSRDASLEAIRVAQERGQTLIALLQKDPQEDRPSAQEFYPIGVELAVGRLIRIPDGASAALVQARRRVELVQVTGDTPYYRARGRIVDEYVEMDQQTRATMRTVLSMFERLVQLNESIPEETYMFAMNIEEPGVLADMVATSLNLPFGERVELLFMFNPLRRLEKVLSLLNKEIQVLELSDEIQSRTQSEMDRSQREYYLREQIKVIQSELGEGDPWLKEIADLRQQIEQANLPEEVKARALTEANRLSQMPPMSPEVGIIRTYLEWLLELPWNAMSEDNLDVEHATRVLDSQHYGLPRAKERILEYIAVRSLKPEKAARQPILCFIGPPGTGKTSLGRSIADALGRKFVRVSLGGVRDEAEIRGHRRTYIGALPGRIIQTIRRAETRNPLFMLDEIDKLGNDYRGDPASALLEVLDPEQNNAFSDHYLELPFDLSQVMFITTANTEATIPPALLDRMELIEFSGYIEEEKIEIARRFIIPRQIEASGLEPDDITFSTGALQRIIREYTYEAGVRNMEREIGRVCRKIARSKAAGKSFPSQITAASMERFLGPPQFFDQEAESTDEVGVATALAWTTNGGEIMPVEVQLIPGKGNLQITGQIGDVMQESAQAGMTYLKAHAGALGLASDIFEQLDVHIHIPEGAIPKDGPSAGITIAAALASAFTGRPIRHDLGMTGEITLRGRVLPIGGVREKVLAAHRSGLKTVLLPEKNQKDLVDVPKKVRTDLQLIFVRHMPEVLEHALLPEVVAPPHVPERAQEDNED